ncbi:PIN domain-containing protein [Kibdelosporangium philippinense]|uniref:Ribonuclease VapC n=1 Tax=Kibdelosporangium philippinense TaxID=211113 RepID=A0ABS8ZM89_9PSEU|nr:TA system VapC family ribonuclease toxin [Kibdelosporangium philippinense]MCE7008278.1 PIN domain-containing protein [Kibdelosporangium philippinense]
MTTLLDANVLIALLVADHVHHDAAEDWFSSSDDHFATCPITEGSLVRLLIREGQTADNAKAILDAVKNSERHEFWPDSISYGDVPLNGVLGHRQVTDSYLAQLARSHGGRLATFDQGLAQLHSDIADLLPTIPSQPSG